MANTRYSYFKAVVTDHCLATGINFPFNPYIRIVFRLTMELSANGGPRVITDNIVASQIQMMSVKSKDGSALPDEERIKTREYLVKFFDSLNKAFGTNLTYQQLDMLDRTSQKAHGEPRVSILANKECEVAVEVGEYKGKPQYNVKYMNPLGTYKIGDVNTEHAGSKKANTICTDVLAVLDGRATTATSETVPGTTGPGAPDNDDDMPF
jgi:hypothetical protein